VEERDPEQIPTDASGQTGTQGHPRAALVAPLDRHDGDAVAPPPGEVDDLGVEDDARDALPREEVGGHDAAEALEAALRVGHGAGHPGRGQEMEEPAERATVEGLARPAIRAVGKDAATQRQVVGRQLLRE